MGSFRERHVLPASMPAGVNPGQSVVLRPDVTIFNWTATDTTMTPTRVDTATLGTATGTITFNATDSVAASNMQTAIRALGGIYANATVVAGVTADNMIITVYGGYDITWGKTGGTGIITESGAAGSDTATPGGSVYTKQLAVGQFAEVKKLVAKNFVDKSLDISVKDQLSKDVYVKTAIDTSAANVVKLLSADAVIGESGAADAASRMGGMFKGPLAVILDTSAPVTARMINFGVQAPGLFVTVLGAGSDRATRKVLLRTATKAALSGTLSLGVSIGNIKRISLKAIAGPGSADATIAPTLTDADGLVVYTKTSTDYTTEVLEQLVHTGFDQADNTQTGLDVIAKSPLTISGSGLGSGSLVIKLWVEA